MSKRLHIVVPYRGRPEQLSAFLRHINVYFARDKADRGIDYCVSIIEQEEGLPFNRGALLDIGFLLREKTSDYTCFHDVDYLPVWADYSWAELPMALVWYGAERRPVAPGRSEIHIQHNLEHFVGGALLVPNGLFRRINGYATAYWGWGYEDIDLTHRLAAANLRWSRRKGTFTPLDHDSHGFDIQGSPTSAAVANLELYQKRWSPGAAVTEDGLSTLNYRVLAREPIQPMQTPEREAPYERIVVALTRD
ncbi:MAG TPA: galactosyltransferase-related protein [Stellaceae bacterium]|jgi:hypothetical protein|nr:galactosyltransferase-related protein [Stellaceae bacterium]